MPYVTVDVDLSDIDTDDLVSELEYRQANYSNTDTGIDDIELLESIFQKRRTGQDYSSELDKLIFNRLGRIS